MGSGEGPFEACSFLSPIKEYCRAVVDTFRPGHLARKHGLIPDGLLLRLGEIHHFGVGKRRISENLDVAVLIIDLSVPASAPLAYHLIAVAARSCRRVGGRRQGCHRRAPAPPEC